MYEIIKRQAEKHYQSFSNFSKKQNRGEGVRWCMWLSNIVSNANLKLGLLNLELILRIKHTKPESDQQKTARKFMEYYSKYNDVELCDMSMYISADGDFVFEIVSFEHGIYNTEEIFRIENEDTTI